MIPRPAALRGYQRSWLRGDLVAGLTVAAYLVPQVMAYATVAGLPPVAGLWAALPALVSYAILGSSPSLSMGPEATTALMTAIAISPLAASDPVRYAELATLLAVLVGLMSAAAWLLRLGAAADLLSRPILVGYMAGVALIMIADQLTRITGVPVAGQAIVSRDGVFALARVKQDLLARLRSFGLADTIGAERMFPTLPTAVAAYRDWAAKQDREPGPGAGER
jgi:sulfate permease, SulP family